MASNDYGTPAVGSDGLPSDPLDAATWASYAERYVSDPPRVAVPAGAAEALADDPAWRAFLAAATEYQAANTAREDAAEDHADKVDALAAAEAAYRGALKAAAASGAATLPKGVKRPDRAAEVEAALIRWHVYVGLVQAEGRAARDLERAHAALAGAFVPLYVEQAREASETLRVALGAAGAAYGAVQAAADGATTAAALAAAGGPLNANTPEGRAVQSAGATWYQDVWRAVRGARFTPDVGKALSDALYAGPLSEDDLATLAGVLDEYRTRTAVELR